MLGVRRTIGIPDMRFINREAPIAEVARELDLWLDGAGKIHCWHPERHQHGDRTASVGIRTSNNTVKCFGCDSNPMGPIDLVMDRLGIVGPADAALWIADRFTVPFIPARKRLTHIEPRRNRAGPERGLGLLIRSGLWATLSEPTKAIAAVLLEFAEKGTPLDETLSVQMAYRTISRYSGIQSPNAIRGALVELGEVGFLVLPEGPRRPLDRTSAGYVITPNSQQLWELAQMTARQQQQEIAAEIELRRRDRNARLQSKRKQKAETQKPDAVCTKYKSLYSRNSVKRKDAIPQIA
jgi:hypothetical protein